jgi:kexin
MFADDHHGTRCAGQIAAVKNDVCGVGIAYESKVAGLRILSGPISDVDEAAALNYGFQNTSIYSCSWGPPDDGMSMDAPGYLIKKAIVHGIEIGRQGKGSIFVFASGNGAAHGDQCNFDGYTNSIYSVTVAAIDYKGLHPYYSEPCAANMVVAYSSGSGKHVVRVTPCPLFRLLRPLSGNNRSWKERMFCDAWWNICSSTQRCRCLCPRSGSSVGLSMIITFYADT